MRSPGTGRRDGRYLLGGLRRKEHEHLATLELRGALDICDLCARVGKPLHDIVAVLRMTHLASAEADRDLDLITVSEELHSVLELCVKVVSVDIERQLDLLDLNRVLVLSGLFLALCLLEAILAVIHDLAYGGSRLRGYLDEIEILFVCDMLCVGSRHDTQLRAVGSDHA